MRAVPVRVRSILKVSKISKLAGSVFITSWLLFISTVGASASEATATLDTTAIRKFYLEGDFDQPIFLLKTCLANREALSHQDSVFVFKHLGVMYSAKYETREKGKYYMRQLLEVEPTARILDMYASEMIYMLFKNIQDEYLAARIRRRPAEPQIHGKAQMRNMPDTSGEYPAKPRRSRIPAWVWVGTAGAAAATGFISYQLLANEPKSAPTNDFPFN